jgi:hypothetical protein
MFLFYLYSALWTVINEGNNQVRLHNNNNYIAVVNGITQIVHMVSLSIIEDITQIVHMVSLSIIEDITQIVHMVSLVHKAE